MLRRTLLILRMFVVGALLWLKTSLCDPAGRGSWELTSGPPSILLREQGDARPQEKEQPVTRALARPQP